MFHATCVCDRCRMERQFRLYTLAPGQWLGPTPWSAEVHLTTEHLQVTLPSSGDAVERREASHERGKREELVEDELPF